MALTQISTGMLASGDGTVDLNIDNGTFVVDVSTSRVGIGTASPIAPLHVAGNAVIETDSPDLYFATTSATHYNWRVAAQETVDGGFEIASGTQSASSNAIADTYTTRFVVKSSGNVGINRASPNGLLHMQSSSGTDSALYIQTSATSDDSVIYFGDDGSSTVGKINYSHSDNSMRFNTLGGEAMRIDTSGNVGIGISTPDNKVHIHKGTAGSVTGNSNAPLTVENSANNYIQMLAPNANETGILFGNPTNPVNAGVVYSGPVGDLQFRNAGNIERMRIAADGNVEMRGSANVRISLGTAGGSGANNSSNWIYGNGTNLRFNNAGGYYSWESLGSERMRMTAAGKLVVNGTVPGYSGTQITVGSPSITTAGLSILSTTSGHGYLLFGDSTGDAAAGYIGQIHYDHSDNSMDLVTNGVKAFEITSDGMLISNQVLADGRHRGMYGIYDPAKIAHIWSMGTAYSVATNGSTAGNLYGLCYSYEPNYQGSGNNAGARSGLGHQMQWRANGSTYTAIGLGIYTTGSVTANSDARLKTDIETIPNAMSKVSALTGITYKRTDLSEEDPATGFQKDVRHTGVIAQDLLAVLPEAVEGAIDGQQPEDGTYLSVAYGNMAGLFIEALKEQQATITALTARIETLENN